MEIHHLVLQSVSLSSRGAELLLCNLEEDGKHCDVGFCSAALMHFRQSGFDVMPKYGFGLAVWARRYLPIVKHIYLLLYWSCLCNL